MSLQSLFRYTCCTGSSSCFGETLLCDFVLHTYYVIFRFLSSGTPHPHPTVASRFPHALPDASYVMLSPCFFRRIFSSHISLACYSYSNCITPGAAAAAAEVQYFRSFWNQLTGFFLYFQTSDFSECSWTVQQACRLASNDVVIPTDISVRTRVVTTTPPHVVASRCTFNQNLWCFTATDFQLSRHFSSRPLRWELVRIRCVYLA